MLMKSGMQMACYQCHKALTTVTIEDGQIVCPNCKTILMTFDKPENRSDFQQSFKAASKRQLQNIARLFGSGGMALVAAATLLEYLSPQIEKTLYGEAND